MQSKQTEFYRKLGWVGFMLSATVMLVLGDVGPLWSVGPLYVASSGVDSGDCTDSATPCRSISYALDQAVAGDEIRVAASSGYTESFTISKDIILRGGYAVGSWEIADPTSNATVLNGQNSQRVIAIGADNLAVTIDGFEITNGAADEGAGINNSSGTNLTVQNSKLYSNMADDGSIGGPFTALGGAISSKSGGQIVIKNNEFYSNQAELGGAIYLSQNQSVSLTGNKIYDNTATGAGAGVALFDETSSLVANNLLYGNRVSQIVAGGGGMYIQDSTANIFHNTFYNNCSTSNGGAVYLAEDTGQTVVAATNNMIVGNRVGIVGSCTNAGTGEGGIHNASGNSTLTSRNNDIYSNIPSQGETTGDNNVTTVPASSQFVSAGEGNFKLNFGARAIDSGLTLAAVTDDIVGTPRPFPTSNIVDRGAYEFDFDSTCFVQLVSTTTVYTSVQSAIDAAIVGDTLNIAGQCSGVTGSAVEGSPQVVRITKNNLLLRGGYDLSDFNNATYGPTLIDAENNGRGIYVDAGVVGTVIENLRITNGNATNGAGVYIAGDARLRNNVIDHNVASGNGDGVYVTGSATLAFNTIADNSGQGVYAASGSSTLNSNIIANNTVNGVEGASSGLFALSYNGFYNNGSSGNSHYGANTSAGTGDVIANPGFTDSVSGDYHLSLATSAVINLADPASTLLTDYEGTARPQGSRSDIGADESTFYVDGTLGDTSNDPVIVGNPTTFGGTTTTFTHTFQNRSNTTESFSAQASNNDGWVISVSPAGQFSLAQNETQTVLVSVTAPSGLGATLDNRTTLTVTSARNSNVSWTEQNLISTDLTELSGFYDESAKPGDVLTYTYQLEHKGTEATPYTILINSPERWGILMFPTQTVTVRPDTPFEILVQVTVLTSAAEGVQDVMEITARNENSGIESSIVSTTTAQATPGHRHVAMTGRNEDNNCTLASTPCATINYALQQAFSSGDDVLVAQGTYAQTTDIRFVGKEVKLLGGYNATFTDPVNDPTNTIIDAQGQARGILVQNALKDSQIDNFMIVNGRVDGGAGGGLSIEGSSTLTVSNVIISDSSAGTGGGVYVNSSGTPVLHSIEISGTTAGGRGGGMYIGSGTLNLEAITITNASATDEGGGLFNRSATLVISRTQISGNRSDTGDGGGIYNDQGRLSLWNSFVFDNQTSAGNGGGIYNSTGSLDLRHDTIARNTASGTGGNIYDNTSSLLLANSIIANGTASSVGGVFYGGGTETYNLFFSNSSGNSNRALGSNSIEGDPLFLDADGGDLHLNIGSAAIDQAGETYALSRDADLENRPVDQGYDIGADEAGGCYVRLEGSDQIYNNLQEAILNNTRGGTILVAGICRGTQTVTYDFGGGGGGGGGGNGSSSNFANCTTATFRQTIFISSSHTLQGGWNADFSQRTPESPMILDAQNQGRVIAVVGDNTVLNLESVVVRHGNATGLAGGHSSTDAGGGIYNCNGTVNLIDSEIYSNTATAGGGVYNVVGVVAVSQTVVSTNTATLGAGLYNLGNLFIADYITASGNIASQNGGAVYNTNNAQFFLDSSWVYSNEAINGGGAFNEVGGVFTSYNTVLASNQAQNGAGFYNTSPNFVVRHNTFYQNAASANGGGINNENSSGTPIINSSIFMENSAVQGGAAIGGRPAFNYNNLFNNGGIGGLTTSDGTGNIAVDPGFQSIVFTNSNFLQIPKDSPVEDQADPNSPLTDDITSKPRPSNKFSDIGAHEVSTCFVRINGVPPTYGNVQTAINQARENSVLLLAGTCLGVNSFVDGSTTVNQTAYFTKSLQMRGGYKLDDWTESKPGENITILDAENSGRVVYVTNNAVVSISGVIMQNGLADRGGAMLVNSGVLTAITSTLRDNQATSQGGAFYNSGGVAFLNSLTFDNNQAVSGGAVYQPNGTDINTRLYNSVFKDNRATNGGAVYNAGTDLSVWHNSFFSNTVTSEGIDLYTELSTVDVRNNLMTYGASGNSVLFSAQSATFDYNNLFAPNISTLYGGQAQAGPNVLSIDPRFGNAEGGDFTIQDSSPVIDRGDPTMPLTHDFQNDFRPGNQGFDMGIDEIPGCKALIVRTEVVYGNVQLAVDAAEKEDVILVTAEECRGVLNRNGISQTVYIDKSITLIGGFDDQFSGTNPTLRTTLNAENLGRVMVISNTGPLTVNGFIFRNGTSTNGGGLYYTNSEDTLITNSVFISNVATLGGAVFNDGGTRLTLEDSTFRQNRATTAGGAIYNNNGDTFNLNDSLVTDNNAPNGAGFYNANGLAILDHGNRFFINNADSDGGAIYSAAGNIRIWNNFIYSNEAQRGAGIFVADGDPQIWHNTLYTNAALNQGGGLWVTSGNATVYNNIFDTQTAPNGGSAIVANSNVSLNGNNFFENAGTEILGDATKGAATFAVDPLYNSEDGDDFSLRDDSPLIDVGIEVGLDHDWENNPRPINRNHDVGADEYNACLVKLVRTGEIYGRIQQVIDQHAEAGDTLYTAIGTCEESVVIDKPLTILGGWTKDFDPAIPLLSTSIVAVEDKRIVEIQSVTSVDLTNLDLFSGTTTANGGGLYTQAERASLNDVTIYYGRAANGGGVSLEQGKSLILNNVTLGNNQATQNGGALYVPPDTAVDVGAGGMIENSAAQHGGAIYADTGSSVILTGGAPVESNTAGGDGGGVYLNNASFALDQKRMNYNTAINGGALYATGSSSFELVNLGMYANQATNGGGIYRNAGGTANLIHATVNQNYASNNAGAIYNAGSSMGIQASIIASNVATGTTDGIQAVANVTLEDTLRWQNEDAGDLTNRGRNITDQDPRIRNAGGDLHPDSPAIDAVTTETGVTIDRFGESRPLICGLDMGRDEFRVFRAIALVNAPDTTLSAQATQAVTYTLAIYNESQNLTFGLPYAAQWGRGIGTGYTETMYVDIATSRGWANFVPNADLEVISPTTAAVFEMASGEAITFQVRVEIPEGTAASTPDDANSFDISTITVAPKYFDRYGTGRSCDTLTGNDADQIYTFANLTTGVLADLDVEISPADPQSAKPGQTVSYTHVVTNTGNSNYENLNVLAQPGLYAAAQAIPNQISLNSGATTTVQLAVTINEEAAKELIDESTVVIQLVREDGSGTIERTRIDQTTVLPTQGTRHVLLVDGRDSLVDETQATTDPNVTDVPDNNCTQPLVNPCATVAHALSEAMVGDTIKLARGTYTETIVLNKSVNLVGGYNPSRWDQELPDHLTFTSRIQVPSGPAIQVTRGQTVTVERLVIQGEGQTGDVTGIDHQGAHLTLRYSRIYDTHAVNGAGVTSNGNLVARNNIFHANTADSQGGAMLLNSGTAMIENNTFYENQANTGSAIALNGASSFVAENNIFSGNNNSAIQADSGSLNYNLYDGDTVAGGISVGPNAVNGDPLFILPGAKPPDFDIPATSPAVDSGDPTTNIATLPFDYKNSARRSGPQRIIDQGAYEYFVESAVELRSDQLQTYSVGTEHTHNYTVTNNSDSAATYNISLSTSQGWASTGVTQVSVAAGSSQTFAVTWNIPNDALGVVDVTRITATLSTDSSVFAYTYNEITAGEVDLTLNLSGPLNGTAGTDYTFTVLASPNQIAQPVTYTWQATDQATVVNSGQGLNNSISFNWSTGGSKQVSVIANNGEDEETASLVIEIASTVNGPAVSVSGATAGLINTAYAYTAQVSNTTATLPITYQWQITDQAGVTRTLFTLQDTLTATWATAGNKQVQVTATNADGSSTASQSVSITSEPQAPQTVRIDGFTSGLTNRSYQFVATAGPLTATQPLQFVWNATNQATVNETVNDLQNTVDFTWTTTGTKQIFVTVLNGAGSVTATTSFFVNVTAIAPTAVGIAGPTVGEPNVGYVFTATVSGDTTTQPITYTWLTTGQPNQIVTDGLSNTISYLWDSDGTKVVSVIASNDGGQVVGEHTIVIKLGQTDVYLPLLLREFSVVQPTATPTTEPGATVTPTPTPTNTPTDSPDDTATPTPTDPVATNTPTATPTDPVATSTPIPTATPQATQPDLIVEQFTITDLGNGIYQAQVTVLNQGTAVPFGNNFFVEIFVDSTDVDAAISWGAQGNWFGAGQRRTFTTQFSADLVGNGGHTFTAWADPFNTVGESSDENNTSVLNDFVIAGASLDVSANTEENRTIKPTPTVGP